MKDSRSKKRRYKRRRIRKLVCAFLVHASKRQQTHKQTESNKEQPIATKMKQISVVPIQK